jgi:hypothetical protein
MNRTLKTIITLPAVFALIALAGCHTPVPQRGSSGLPAKDITVSVSCSDRGMKFKGTIVADGHSKKLSGRGSGMYHASGQKIVCSFQKLDVDGRITLVVSEAGRKLGESSTPDMFGGVRAELFRAPTDQHCIFTTF